MKLFKCDNCGQLLYFENNVCECCKNELGFVPEILDLVTLKKDDVPPSYRVLGKNQPLIGRLFNSKEKFKYCKNHEFEVCNWLIPAESTESYCNACQLNHIIPDLSNSEHLRQWQLIEAAKHRLVYTLLQLNLPVTSKITDPENGLRFDFLSDENSSEKVLTGHENGLITLNVAEADDDKRELARKQMNEPYRTLLGHFRHEVGHYYWDILVKDKPVIEEYRKLFGDEREDYGLALERNYNEGAPADWELSYISTYASSHSWEDWAETWAHYLHIMDTLQTAGAFGIKVAPGIAKDETLKANINVNPYKLKDFNQILDLWLPLTYAMNSMNRSMGHHDLYPFIIHPKVVEKLAFIHKLANRSIS